MSAVIKQAYLAYRPMQMGDVEHIMKIERSVYRHSWTTGIFRDCLRAGYTAIVAEKDKEIIGYAVLSSAAGEAHLLNICITPEKQGNGYGRQLLTYLIRLAYDKKVGTLFLEVRASNQQAQQLYLSEGFNEIGFRPNYYPLDKGREDALVYAMDLLD